MESIKVVFAILMIQNGSTIEMVPTDGLSDCLKQKRIIARNIGEEQQGIYGQPIPNLGQAGSLEKGISHGVLRA